MEKEVKIKNFPDLRTVYLTGEINADSLYQFKKDLDLLVQADEDIFESNYRNLAEVDKSLAEYYKKNIKFPTIKVDISSPGGSVYCGLSIYDIIRAYNKAGRHKISTKGSGYVASAATIVLLAADERTCTENTTFIIHSISSWYNGKLQDLEDDLEETRRLADITKKIYVDRTNITNDKLLEIDKLKKDWVLTAQEAYDCKLVNKIL